jgi:hypothetical protein
MHFGGRHIRTRQMSTFNIIPADQINKRLLILEEKEDAQAEQQCIHRAMTAYEAWKKAPTRRLSLVSGVPDTCRTKLQDMFERAGYRFVCSDGAFPQNIGCYLSVPQCTRTPARHTLDTCKSFDFDQ